MTEDPFDRAVQRYEAAEDLRRRRGRARSRRGLNRGWRIHAAVFAATQALIFAIWLAVALTTRFYFPWFVFPLLGWGIGLVAHYVAIRPDRSQSDQS